MTKLVTIGLGCGCLSPLRSSSYTGADQNFKLGGGGGGGGAHLKKLRRAVGGAKMFGGISCAKSRFYAKKSYFSQF